MGNISNIPVESLIEGRNIKTAVETGTHNGFGARHLSNIFEEVHTIELIPEVFYSLVGQLPSNVTIHLGESSETLEYLFKDILRDTEPIFYWLDAHLPSLHHNQAHEFEIEFPLERELRNICLVRDVSKDVFVIDDLRIYMDGPFESGNWKERPSELGDSIDFIVNLFEKTHEIKLSYKDEGYIILTPIRSKD